MRVEALGDTVESEWYQGSVARGGTEAFLHQVALA